MKTLTNSVKQSGAAKAFRAESRARVAELAAKGQGQAALAESLSALGIDLNNGKKSSFRIVGYNGASFHRV